jgi:molecular chaperone Hsp33
MHDHLIRAIAPERNLRVVCAVTSRLVAEAATRHALSPAAACAMGRALTSGLLLATLTKGGERCTIQLVGDGPLGGITVDATDAGDVRGYARNTDAGAGGRASIARALGRNGVVNVVRDVGLKDLYQGQVALTNGEIDEDLETYLRVSEQVPSALGCDVVLGDDGRVLAAGGILVQSLPEGDSESVREMQHELRTGRLFEVLRAQPEVGARALAEQLYTLGRLEPIGEERQVRFQCRCSQEKIGDMLKLLSTVDLDEMIAEDKPAEVTCNFCNQRYEIRRSELERIRALVAPRQSN